MTIPEARQLVDDRVGAGANRKLLRWRASTEARMNILLAGITISRRPITPTSEPPKFISLTDITFCDIPVVEDRLLEDGKIVLEELRPVVLNEGVLHIGDAAHE